MNSELLYQFHTELENCIHSFQDSVAIYNPYDGTTYLFNPIVKWLYDTVNGQPFLLSFTEKQIKLEYDYQENAIELMTLYSKTVERLIALKIIELLPSESC